jgi:cardiolipin synthase (CMP-forming)
MWRYLPNAISVLRGLATFPVVWLILDERWRAAFWLALIAGLSDLIDGWLAKRFQWQSRIGAGLDGLADKLLLFGIFLALVLIGRLPLWWLILVLVRDLIIVVGAWFYNRLIEKLRPEPTALGKVSTAAQITLALLIIANSAWQWHLPDVERALFWFAVAMTSLSGIHYIAVWAGRARRGGILRGDKGS